MGSAKFKLDWSDIIGVAKNAALVGGAAALTVITESLGEIDLGIYGPLFVPIVAVGLDTAIKWLKDNASE